MDTIPAPVFYRDTKGVYYDCNRAFEELVGLHKVNIIGKDIYDFFEKDLADLYSRKDQEIIDNPRLQQYENEINNSRGERIDVMFSKTARFKADWTVDGIVGVILDISERKKMEKELQNNVIFLETFLDAMPSPAFYRNLESVYQICNEMFASFILGRSKAEVIGKSMYDFKKEFPEAMLRTTEYYDRLLLKAGKSQPHEVRISCAGDGKLRDFLVHKARFKSVSGEVIGIVGVLLDITERKKAERALLEAENLRKKEIHHRIKNNLQVISSLLSLQAEQFHDEKVIEAFEDSQHRVISMSLIHEELYKTEDAESLDFTAYLQKLTQELLKSYNIGDKAIQLKLELENVFLEMDTAIPLGIIINELVSNSLKHAFSEKKSGEIKVKLCREKNESSGIVLIVSDNGKGLEAEIDFRKTSSLGLQLVTTLVDQIEGKIELEKDPGTKFIISFRERKEKSQMKK